MIGSRSRAAAIAVAAAWVLAIAAPVASLRTLSAFAVVFLAPGWFLDRAFGGEGAHRVAEAPARALALSVGVLGILATMCSALGLSIAVVHVMLGATTLLLALGGSRRPRAHALAPTARAASPAPHVPLEDAGGAGWLALDGPVTALAARAATASAIVLAAAAVVLAALDTNLSRDRMWYGAYVTQLATGGALDWREPMLASGEVVWRFAHNAWLVALSAWSSLAAVDAPYLLERAAPPLLVGLVPFSSFVLARALWRDRNHAAIATLAVLTILLASSYPYFSPERYAFFARIVEDKTAALVLLAPVALGLGIDTLSAPSVPRVSTWLRFALALVATALTHAIVYLLVALALGSYSVLRLRAGRCSRRSVAVALAIVAAVALVPAELGFRARHDVLAIAAQASPSLAVTHADDPIVRAHLRMERLRHVSVGGPTVDPRLLADPLLLLALIGLIPALVSWRSPWGAFLSAATVMSLALAFMPFVAPAFGRLVVPWMAYRALWGVPFGVLLGALTITLITAAELSELARVGRAIALSVVAALLVLGARELPWTRALPPPAKAARLAPREDTGALVAAIAALPTNARVAAAPGLAEMLPAHTGRAVLALSDRGTVVFARSRAAAEERLIANAAIVGLHGTSTKLRKRLIAGYGVTHVVYEGTGCDLAMRTVVVVGRYTVCETSHEASTAHSKRPARLARFAAVRRARDAGLEIALAANPLATASVRPHLAHALAELERDLTCHPVPTREGPSFGWRRHGRWSGAFVSVDCSVRFDRPQRVRGIAVRGHLPRAREALLVDARAWGTRARCAKRTAVLELTGDRAAALALRCKRAREVHVRLVPAFLPYLNLSELEVR